jgi:hypothetical protein
MLLQAGHKYSDAKLDVLAAVVLSINILQGAPTFNRLLLLRLCFHVLFQPVRGNLTPSSPSRPACFSYVTALMALAVVWGREQDFVKEQEMEELKAGLKKLELLSELGDRIRDSTKCDFLFWSKNMLPPHFDDIYANPETAHKLHVRPLAHSL